MDARKPVGGSRVVVSLDPVHFAERVVGQHVGLLHEFEDLGAEAGIVRVALRGVPQAGGGVFGCDEFERIAEQSRRFEVVPAALSGSCRQRVVAESIAQVVGCGVVALLDHRGDQVVEGDRALGGDSEALQCGRVCAAVRVREVPAFPLGDGNLFGGVEVAVCNGLRVRGKVDDLDCRREWLWVVGAVGDDIPVPVVDDETDRVGVFGEVPDPASGLVTSAAGREAQSSVVVVAVAVSSSGGASVHPVSVRAVAAASAARAFVDMSAP